jgi:hypothetical protein
VQTDYISGPPDAGGHLADIEIGCVRREDRACFTAPSSLANTSLLIAFGSNAASEPVTNYEAAFCA